MAVFGPQAPRLKMNRRTQQHLSGVPLWRGTRCDDLRGRYDAVTHRLAGGTEPAPLSEPRGDEAPRPGSRQPGGA